jgi:hypothetical protein
MACLGHRFQTFFTWYQSLHRSLDCPEEFPSLPIGALLKSLLPSLPIGALLKSLLAILLKSLA